MEKNIKLILLGTIIIIVSLGFTYYCGNYKGLSAGELIGIEKGKELGRAELLAEQEEAEAAALLKIQEAANIYGDEDGINPYSDSYQNPFAE